MPHSPSEASIATPTRRRDYRDPFPRLLPWLLLIGGLLGTVAASVLTVEKMARLRDPAYVPSCSLNPIVSCGSVMDSPQAAAFGLPNSVLGIAGFAVVTTVGAGLLSGARFQRWFWLGLQAGVSFGVVFVHWSNSQILWIGSRQATSDTGVSGEGSGVMSTGRSRSLPLWNTA
ncbi:vitamin K epoxide reductase family protein, partial [Nocardia farcinica]|nr:vitamin K epoxide reductase family protein [Nocardia farcinica]